MDKRFVSLVFLFLMAFGLFAILVIFNKPISTATRAKEETDVSAEKSGILAFPVQAKADGNSTSTITVFSRNSKGEVLANKVIEVKSTLGDVANITTEENIKKGIGIFKLTSKTSGIAKITAIIDKNVEVNHSVSVQFN